MTTRSRGRGGFSIGAQDGLDSCLCFQGERGEVQGIKSLRGLECFFSFFCCPVELCRGVYSCCGLGEVSSFIFFCARSIFAGCFQSTPFFFMFGLPSVHCWTMIE